MINLCIFFLSVHIVYLAWPHRNHYSIVLLIGLVLSYCLTSFFTLNVYTATSFESKQLISRLRFIGFSFITPFALLFFTAFFNKWKKIHSLPNKVLIFIPPLITNLFALNILPAEHFTSNHLSYIYNDISVISYKTEIGLYLHLAYSFIITTLILFLLVQNSLKREYRKYTLLLSAGLVSAFLLDSIAVLLNTPSRWLMLSVVSFAITELAILYVSSKTGFFGAIPIKQKERNLENKIEFQQKLLALLSHDLQGNLHTHTKISSFFKDKLQDTDSNLIHMLTNSESSSKKLLSNILEWIKYQDSNEIILTKTKVNALDIINESIITIKHAYPTKEITVSIEEESKNIFINIDKEIFSSIIRNILSNAFNASQDKSTINISIAQDEIETKFAIQDFGKGISEKDLDLINNNEYAKSSSSGHGIGLSLIKYFIKLHSGKLLIKSAYSKGTTVFFTITNN